MDTRLELLGAIISLIYYYWPEINDKEHFLFEAENTVKMLINLNIYINILKKEAYSEVYKDFNEDYDRMNPV